MIPRQGNRMRPIIAILAGTLREILETLYRKYPAEFRSVCTGEDAPVAGSLACLEDLIFQYSGDEEIQEIVARRFRECGFVIDSIPGTISPAAGQQYDLYSELDEGSACIIRTLYERRHATLDDLSACSGLPHYDVLHRLREIIIPMSVARRGRPIAVFRESGIDLATGRQIAFSWWLNDDILHKTDAVEVVETSDSLVITLDRTGRNLPKTLHASATCRHGILEIRVDTGQKEGEHEEG